MNIRLLSVLVCSFLSFSSLVHAVEPKNFAKEDDIEGGLELFVENLPNELNLNILIQLSPEYNYAQISHFVDQINSINSNENSFDSIVDYEETQNLDVIQDKKERLAKACVFLNAMNFSKAAFNYKTKKILESETLENLIINNNVTELIFNVVPTTAEMVKLAHKFPNVKKIQMSSILKDIEKFEKMLILVNLRLFQNLIALDLDQNGIEAAGVKHIAYIKNLKELNLSWNNIGSRGCQFLSKLDHLTCLDLSWNHLGPKEMKYLAKISSLLHLTINHNQIGDLGVEYLTKFSNIEELNVIDNSITIDGAIYLSRFRSLKSVCVLQNHIGAEGLKLLSVFLSLENFDIYDR
jgi:hypothetical protein